MDITNNTTDTNTQQPYIPDQPCTSTISTQSSTSNQQSTLTSTASPQPSTANQSIPSISRRNASAASNQLLPQQTTRVSTRTRKPPKRLADYIID